MNRWMHTSIVAALPLGGCFYSIENHCEDVRRTGDETRGDLVGIESEASAAELPDYPRERIVTTNGLAREVVPVRDGFGHSGGRFLLDLGLVDLELDAPPGPGKTTLAALHGQVCENWVLKERRACHPVDGEVDVAAIAPPCGDGVCGVIDLTIRIAKPDPLPPEAVVHGTARLLYREWKEQSCRMVHEGSNSAFAVEL